MYLINNKTKFYNKIIKRKRMGLLKRSFLRNFLIKILHYLKKKLRVFKKINLMMSSLIVILVYLTIIRFLNKWKFIELHKVFHKKIKICLKKIKV